MSTASATADTGHGHSDGHEEHIHPPIYYIKIWAILVVCLAVSVAGPMLEIRAVTLITAFGIAFFKAYLVCSKFMHLNIQPKFVVYFLTTALAFMALFFFAIAPDILNHHGANWVNVGAKAEIERHGGHDGGGDVHEAKGAEHGGEHGKPAEHGGGHGAAAVEAESPEIAAHKAAAAKKLEGIEASMKAVEAELKTAATVPTTTPPPVETPKEEAPKPEAPKAEEHH